ncbi:MAG: two-component sensor histidine kinase [Coriobacteriales bacterium]|jgi:two-component system phosphate regulon sensor histidine kinase PhoR|nr:two-component sensor histidine kinase [Coriobacteriales bacterium]
MPLDKVAPTDREVPSLTSRIFRIIFLVAFVTELICVLVMSLILVQALEREKQTELSTEATAFVQTLKATDDAKRAALMPSFATKNLRVTWIDEQGAVLYDSGIDGVVATENHSNRPEVIAAHKSGAGTAKRLSSTLGEVTYYHATQLDDGTVLRLAATQNNALSALRGLLIPALLVLVATALIAALIARRLARRIAAPLLTLNLDEPLTNKVYDEATPLLERMDEQKRRIATQAKEGLATRREFTANVSHELKTPLTVISGYAELMQSGQARAEDTQHFAGLIFSEAEHMQELVEDILIISQLDEEEATFTDERRGSEEQGVSELRGDERIELVDLDKLASDCIYRLTPFADQHNVSVSLKSEPELLVRGSKRILSSMVYNLCENAIRYNKAGGSVAVEVAQQKENVVLSVTDTGIGIAPEYQERVFERFFRVDKTRSRETGGTGLGLSIVKHAAAYHGAELSLTSSPETGTTVSVIFAANAQ